MSALHRAVDAMLAQIAALPVKPITIPDGSISAALRPGKVIGLSHHALSLSHAGPPPVEVRRDLGRRALAAALRELAAAASPAASFELRAIAEELDTRCPDCGRHLTRDPWRHCATCEPTTTPGVTP